MHSSSYITQEAFRAIYDEYKNRLYGYVLTITHSSHAAEEVTQELFIKIWTNREMLENVKDMERYIFTMARNRTLNYMRKASNDARILKELQRGMVSRENNVAERMLIQDYERLVKEALDRLSPRRNQVYRLSFYQGMKLEEIAAQMNLSRNTVKNHLVAARKFIRSYLIERGIIFLMILSYFF